MWNELLYAFEAVATLPNFIAMAAGIWGGVIIGAIPGMTGTMAVTLALPFTFCHQHFAAGCPIQGIDLWRINFSDPDQDTRYRIRSLHRS